MGSSKNEINLSDDVDLEQQENKFWTPSLTDSSPPVSILLALWPHANSERIEYYTECYKALYPSAQIVPLHYTDPTKHIPEALDALVRDEEKPQTESGPERVLIHAFGNSATSHMGQLLQTFKARTGQRLAIRAIVFDEEPSIILSSPLDFVQLLPIKTLTFLHALIWGVLNWLVSIIRLGYVGIALTENSDGLQDTSIVPEDAIRCYVWASKHRIFAWTPSSQEGVIERLEYTVKRRRVDNGPKYSMDQERYWAAIEEAWKSTEQLKN